jgi:hypothetical protein
VLQIIFLINGQKKRKRPNISVKQELKLIEKLESGVSVVCVCEEYGHLDLMDIQQYWTNPPPS